MSRRRTYDPEDWTSIARRLDEVISAHSGEHVFDEVAKLLIAKLHAERAGVEFTPAGPAEVNALLSAAAWRWPSVLVDGETRLGDPEIRRAAEILRAVRLGDDQLVGLNALFQAIISRSARGEKGQFFTPLPIVREVVRRLRPLAGEVVCDPACGLGGFLLEALRTEPECEVWGFDHDPRVVSVARSLLVIAGQCGTHARQVDSLRLGAIEEVAPAGFTGFDVILTNPPFAGDVGEHAGRGFELGSGRAVERDVLFLERCVKLLRPGGRFGIIVPDNKVAAQRLAAVRRWLLCNTRLTTVIALDRDAFMPWTSQKACVLIGVRRSIVCEAPPGDEAIELVGAIGAVPKFRRSPPAIGTPREPIGQGKPSPPAIGSPTEPIGGGGTIRTIADLDPGWVLAPERYAGRGAGAGPAAGDRAVAGGGRRVGDVVEVLSEAHRPTALPTGLPALVLDTSHAYEGVVLARHAPVPITEVGSPKRILQPGDVIISRLRSYLRQVAVVDEALFERSPGGNLVLASAEFFVLRGAHIDAAALVPLLLSDGVQKTLAAAEEGGHHPRFRKEALAGIGVPDAVYANAADIAREVRRVNALVRAGLAGMDALVAGTGGSPV